MIEDSYGLGIEVSCTDAMRTGRLVTGPRLIGEAAYRRLTTPRGMLRGGEDEANYGLDLCGLIGSVTSRSDAIAIGGRVKTELRKDERISEVTVGVVMSTTGPAVSLQITVEALTAAGPFTLVIGVNDVTTSLLKLEAA